MSLWLDKWEQHYCRQRGTIVLKGDLCLNNVLSIPGLTCKLISVSQLTDHCNCFVLFTDDLCVIENSISRMLIGASEQRDGLCYFRGIPCACAMKADCVATLDLWHKRLGQPSL